MGNVQVPSRRTNDEEPIKLFDPSLYGSVRRGRHRQFITSATNTLRTWYIRRAQKKSELPSTERLEKEANKRWSKSPPEVLAEIVRRVKATTPIRAVDKIKTVKDSSGRIIGTYWKTPVVVEGSGEFEYIWAGEHISGATTGGYEEDVIRDVIRKLHAEWVNDVRKKLRLYNKWRNSKREKSA